MNNKLWNLIPSLFLFGLYSVLFAEPTDKSGLFLGVHLSKQPIPELLSEHLNLTAGEGIIIDNIAVGSPADLAGLDQNDIIIKLDNQPVISQIEFVNEIKRSQPGRVIQLTVIQHGRTNTAAITLTAPASDTIEWKYQMQAPQMIFRPGRILTRKFGQDDWIEAPISPDSSNQTTTFNHVIDGKNVTVVIAGNPYIGQTKIVITLGDQTVSTTIAMVQELKDEKLRDAVIDDIQTAQETQKELKFRFEFDPADPRYYYDFHRRQHVPNDQFDIEKWKEFEKQLPELKDSYKDKADQLKDKLDEMDTNLTNQLTEIKEQMRKLQKDFDELLKKLEAKQRQKEETTI